MFTDKMLKDIREKISCPQFGDKHYGEWGILNLTQRRTILKLLDYIEELKADREWTVDCIESEKVIQTLKTQIDLADLNKVAVIPEVPLSTPINTLLLLKKLIADGDKQQKIIEELQFSRKLHLETEDGFIKIINGQAAEIEKLRNEIAEQEHAKCIPCINETKKQAFKEFVARMEMLFECNYNDDHCVSIQHIKKHIHKTAEILESECK